jgi:hypothetical protein
MDLTIGLMQQNKINLCKIRHMYDMGYDHMLPIHRNEGKP